MADYSMNKRDDDHEACGINGHYCSNKCPKLDRGK